MEKIVLSKNSSKTRRVTLVVFLVVLVVALAGGGLWITRTRSSQNKQTTIADNTNYYKEAAQYLDPTKATELKTVIDKIQQVKNYEQDPNMLCPIVLYYIYVGDTANAQKYFNKLNNVQNEFINFSSTYSGVVTTKGELSTRITDLNRVQENDIKNARYYD